MSDKLRECPFCGDGVDTPEPIIQVDDSQSYMIQCCNCGLSMSDFSINGLIVTWNNRVFMSPRSNIPSDIKAMNEELNNW